MKYQILHIRDCFTGLEEYYCIQHMKSMQVISLESASVEAGNDKFENEKTKSRRGVELKRSQLTRPL